MIDPTALNAICPYFTMFPLDFPLRVIRRSRIADGLVFDPFAGRGTTAFAARVLGLPSLSVDSSPVATAIASAKLVSVTPEDVLATYDEIMRHTESSEVSMPKGRFWSLLFHRDVLRTLMRLRTSLLADCSSASRTALRAVVLGALHGPIGKLEQSYFSNQCQRTYAPKPMYAVRFWQAHGLRPKPVDVRRIIAKRANRYFASSLPATSSAVVRGDSTNLDLSAVAEREAVKLVITSPPYFGLRTYLQDQWLRLWFVGGSSNVTYKSPGQLSHSSPDAFADSLRCVWNNAAMVAAADCRLVVRFGAINSAKCDSVEILKSSLRSTPWRLETITSAGYSSQGKRQASHFRGIPSAALEEHDFWASLN